MPDDVVALRALVASLRAEKETLLLLRRAIALAQRVKYLEKQQDFLRYLLRNNYSRSWAVMDCDNEKERWKFNFVLAKKHRHQPVSETQFRQLWDTGYLLEHGDDSPEVMLWDRFDTGDVVWTSSHIRPLTYAEYKWREATGPNASKAVYIEHRKESCLSHGGVGSHVRCGFTPCKKPHICCPH